MNEGRGKDPDTTPTEVMNWCLNLISDMYMGRTSGKIWWDYDVICDIQKSVLAGGCYLGCKQLR